MTIVIKMPGENTSEFAIIELQGDLRSYTETKFDGKFVGDLHFLKTGAPILIIGHHLLYGKEVKMEKPFALLKKQGTTSEQTEYHVECVITKKLLFKTRPKPIVGTPKGKGK